MREILTDVTFHCVVTARTVASGRSSRGDGKDPTQVREPGSEACVEAEGRGVVKAWPGFGHFRLEQVTLRSWEM